MYLAVPDLARRVRAGTNHEPFASGRLEVMNSDGVIFRMEPAYLSTSSGVIRDMIELSTVSSKIELNDEKNETASVLEVFLDIIHGKPLPTPDWNRQIQVLANVIELA